MNNNADDGSKTHVTVCMTTYNHAAYIEESIESVMSQNVDSLHMIIADDASTDGTDKICQTMKKKYPQHITVIQQPKNLGVQHNLDTIYQQIPDNTTYLAWSSGDDLMLPGKLQQQINFMDENLYYVMCYHNTLVRDDENNIEYGFNAQFWGQKPFAGRIEKHLIEIGCFISSTSVFVRWNSLKHIRPNKALSIYNDWCYFIEMAMHGKVGYIDEMLGVYRRHQTNLTRMQLDDDGPVYILEYIQEKYGYEDAINKGLLRHYLAFAWKYLLKREFYKFFTLYGAALRIASKKWSYFSRFLLLNIFLIYQRVGLLLKTGRLFR